MKKTLRMLLALLVITGGFACQKDEITPTPPAGNPVSVKFGDDEFVSENAPAKAITLQFDKPAPTAGIITVKVSADLPGSFQTTPAIMDGEMEIPVAKGSRSVSFTITPVNNNSLHENRAVTFEITAVPEGFRIGPKKTTTVTILDDETPVDANFPVANGILRKDQPAGITVGIQLTGPAPSEGKIIVQLNSLAEAERFTTQPALSASGRIELPVAFGMSVVNFKVMPADNTWNGDKTVAFSIAEAYGSVTLGNSLSFELSLVNPVATPPRPRSYETVGGGWRVKNTYEYDEAGKVKKVHWEQETPFFRQGTYTYYYAQNGLIERVNQYADSDEYFYQENGRIVRSEKITNGEKASYALYDYDAAGNIGEMAVFHRQPNGAYLMSYTFAYLYHTDGNIYKKLTYTRASGSGELILNATHTYEGYSDVPNPFPMLEIIPGIPAQRHLPGSYRMEEHGMNLLYTFRYDFRADGLPAKRHTSGNASEVTTFEYY